MAGVVYCIIVVRLSTEMREGAKSLHLTMLQIQLFSISKSLLSRAYDIVNPAQGLLPCLAQRQATVFNLFQARSTHLEGKRPAIRLLRQPLSFSSMLIKWSGI